jgi:hypothetical protein
MPTADAFDAAARSFDGVAESLDLLLRTTPTHFGPDTLLGGHLSLVADLTVSTATATAVTAATIVADHAATCRQRASACRTYAADVAAYRRELDRYEAGLVEGHSFDVGTTHIRHPTPPERPFTWIDM